MGALLSRTSIDSLPCLVFANKNLRYRTEVEKTVFAACIKGSFLNKGRGSMRASRRRNDSSDGKDGDGSKARLVERWLNTRYEPSARDAE